MVELVFWCLTGSCGLAVILGLRKPSGYLEFPTLVAAVFLGWVVPQLWQVRQGVTFVESEYFVTLNLFTLACFLSIHLGWNWGVGVARRGSPSFQLRAPSYKGLLRIGFAISAVAWAMQIGMGMRPLDELNMTQWSGPLTIMYFVFNVKVIALFLSIYLAIKYRSTASYVLLASAVALYIPLILIYFRRRAMVEMFTCLVLALWFARRVIVPRIFIVFGMPVGALVIFGVGALRSIASETGEWKMPTLAQIRAIDFWSLTPFATEHATPELTNALYLVRLADQWSFHTFGAGSWNRIIFQYVPAQLVGADLKNWLMFDLGVAERLYNQLYYAGSTGATSTAMGDAYLEFGFFGVIFFVAMAYVMGRWWARASRGDVWAATFYASGLAPALIMPTAYAFYFFNVMILYGGVICGARYFLGSPVTGRPVIGSGVNAASRVQRAKRPSGYAGRGATVP
ncbi:hypothetical protein [Mesorhizobium sp. M0633]|uniref:hypothetical protein n=1 Tax=Mesorhizobium sp. M0633 TaxID=2956977 RepID=UPI003334A82D